MAIPQILQQLQQTSQPAQVQIQNPQLLNNLKQAVSAFKAIKNPQEFLQNAIIQNNPQVAEVMQYIQNNGSDPQSAFYKYAQDKGIDPNQILSQLM